MHFDEFDEFTRKLCVETQKTILSAYRNPELVVETKSDDTPVTFADRETEREIREAIQVLYPEHGIKGEEFDDVNPDAEMTWIIDPIDGTKSFAAGSPLFGTMIALLERGQPIFGCINYPAIGDRISGDGEAAYVNGSPVSATVGKPLDKSILLCTDQQYIDQVKGSKNFDQLSRMTYYTRTWGDCFGYYLVACGKADIMLDPEMNPWDLMALIPIIRGSGAMISDWEGGDPARGSSIVAANSDLHADVIRILNA